jgi:hypothetical protein
MTKLVITYSTVCLQDILYGVDDLSVKTKIKTPNISEIETEKC